jgi:hypothetical protein
MPYTEEESSKTKKYQKRKKTNEAKMTLQEIGDLMGIMPGSVQAAEKRGIKKLVMGLKERGCSFCESILAVQKLLGVNDPRVVLDCLDEDYIEKTRQFAKKTNIEDL